MRVVDFDPPLEFQAALLGRIRTINPKAQAIEDWTQFATMRSFFSRKALTGFARGLQLPYVQQAYVDLSDSNRLEWQDFWNGWPGSGYSAFIAYNVPLSKYGEILLDRPPRLLGLDICAFSLCGQRYYLRTT